MVWLLCHAHAPIFLCSYDCFEYLLEIYPYVKHLMLLSFALEKRPCYECLLKC
jgi:hypothetical protein